MGLPSHDTFNNVLARLKPEAFEACLLEWVLTLHEVTEGQIIPIDGRPGTRLYSNVRVPCARLRGSYGRGDNKATIHMVSAWASQNHIRLGQVTVDEKSNEITAIPKLLKMIEISGALVTIDAMGCQTEIAATIVEEGGDYCLAVKDNQPQLLQATQEFFEDHLADDFARQAVRRYATQERGHGRVEEREYFLAPLPEDFAPGLAGRICGPWGLRSTTSSGRGSMSPRCGTTSSASTPAAPVLPRRSANTGASRTGCTGNWT